MTHPCTVTYVDVQKCAKIVQHHTLHCCVRDMWRNNYSSTRNFKEESPAEDRSTGAGEVVVTVICSSLYT